MSRITPEREAALRRMLTLIVEDGFPDEDQIGLRDALDDLADLRARWQPVVEAWVNHETVTCANTERLLRDAIAKAVSNG